MAPEEEKIFFIPPHDTSPVAEFFGYLGSQILHHAKKCRGTTSSGASSERRHPLVEMAPEQLEEMMSTYHLHENMKHTFLAHQEGYRWASKLDLHKIHDWEQFYSMSEAEVRRRFFTNRPDYSGL